MNSIKAFFVDSWRLIIGRPFLGSAVPRDDRFRYFSHEPPAILPDDYTSVLSNKTTLELIQERDDWYNRTVRCECCGGTGRSPAVME